MINVTGCSVAGNVWSVCVLIVELGGKHSRTYKSSLDHVIINTDRIFTFEEVGGCEGVS